MRNRRRIENGRPLAARFLAVFLSIWIALAAAPCISGCALSGNTRDNNSGTQNTQTAERPSSDKGSAGKSALDSSSLPSTQPSDSSGASAGGSPATSVAPQSTSNLVDNFTVPVYSGNPFAQVNGNSPAFNADLIEKAKTGSFEDYWPADSLGRPMGAVVCAGLDTMPEGERGSIGDIRPPGFSLDRYDWVDGKYLYNRCHLIGWQLTGENSNTRNLITGTRYLNVDGMLPYENRIDDYIESTGNHVLYRSTPIYQGSELIARGVLLEAFSIEDDGRGLSFCVFCFNVQPGVTINYTTGANSADGSMQEKDLVDETQFDYILNTNSKKIHYPDCPSVDDMKEKNKRGFNGTVEEAKAQGYSPCGRCKP